MIIQLLIIVEMNFTLQSRNQYLRDFCFVDYLTTLFQYPGVTAPGGVIDE
jgi:hypothetical protein